MIAELVARTIDKHHPLDRNPTFKATCDRILKIPPSVTFLLCLLGTLDPRHSVFSKGYVKLLRRTQIKQNVVIQNDGFFDDLLVSKKQGGRLRIGAPVMQTKSKQERRIEKLQSKM